MSNESTPWARVSRDPDRQDRAFAGRRVRPIHTGRVSRLVLCAFEPDDEIARQFGFTYRGDLCAFLEPESIEYPPVPFVVRIEGTDYQCVEIGSHVEDVSQVIRVEREPTAKETAKGEGPFVYDVSVHSGGWIECTCPHYEFRLRGTEGTCKHGRICLDMGIIKIPSAGHVR